MRKELRSIAGSPRLITLGLSGVPPHYLRCGGADRGEHANERLVCNDSSALCPLADIEDRKDEPSNVWEKLKDEPDRGSRQGDLKRELSKEALSVFIMESPVS
ncbi:MAG: hypothetical protein AAF662_07955 [Pseudomonadota bacterium]